MNRRIFIENLNFLRFAKSGKIAVQCVSEVFPSNIFLTLIMTFFGTSTKNSERRKNGYCDDGKSVFLEKQLISLFQKRSIENWIGSSYASGSWLFCFRFNTIMISAKQLSTYHNLQMADVSNILYELNSSFCSLTR